MVCLYTQNVGRTHELWSISYDDILRIDMSSYPYLVGYADDIAADIEALNKRMHKVREAKSHNKVMVKLATGKIELLLITRNHITLELHAGLG